MRYTFQRIDFFRDRLSEFSFERNQCGPCNPKECDPCNSCDSRSSFDSYNPCNPDNSCSPGGEYDSMLIPAEIFNVKKVWNLDIKTVTGRISTAIDDNGIMYHKLTEIFFPSEGNPYFRLTENSLLFGAYIIDYDIFNIMGVCDLSATFRIGGKRNFGCIH